jgi:serine/threonine-protein phosphatase 2B catalytic subunit
MLLAILSICSEEELGDSSTDGEEDEKQPIPDVPTPAEVSQRRQQIKNKILAVGKMQRVFQLLRCVWLSYFALPIRLALHLIPLFFVCREEAENATELTMEQDMSGMANVAARLGPDALGVQGNQIRRHIRSFDDA